MSPSYLTPPYRRSVDPARDLRPRTLLRLSATDDHAQLHVHHQRAHRGIAERPRQSLRAAPSGPAPCPVFQQPPRVAGRTATRDRPDGRGRDPAPCGVGGRLRQEFSDRIRGLDATTGCDDWMRRLDAPRTSTGKWRGSRPSSPRSSCRLYRSNGTGRSPPPLSCFEARRPPDRTPPM